MVPILSIYKYIDDNCNYNEMRNIFFTIYTIDQGKAIIKVEEFKTSQNLKHDSISKCSKCSIYCFINYSKITMKDIFLTSQRKQVFY